MAEFNFSLTDGNPDELAKLNKTLNWLMNNLDHDNITRIYTEYCDIQSENGETVIDGPLIKMTAGTTTTRLKMGKEGSAFTFALYNNAGVQTVGIDSSGNGKFTGEITGSVITGGLIQTSTAGARITVESSGLIAYDSNNARRIAIKPTTAAGLTYYELEFYNESGSIQGFFSATTNKMDIAGYNNLYITATLIDFGFSKVQFWGHTEFNSNIGFFGSTASAKVSVANLSTTATLGVTINKLNEFLDALQTYNLV